MTDAYVIDINDYHALKRINERLFSADNIPFKTDERRDLANLMHVILDRAAGINTSDWMSDDNMRKLVSLAKDVEIAKLRGVLQDFYDWCGKDYPGWPAVEAALQENP